MRLAIIPVRGGSKRIPGKNIRNFAGKPLIAYPIEACLQSALFEHVLVSTDSEEIAAVAREAGAETPFMRPAELADDHTATHPVVEHALAWADAHWGECAEYCQLYANPFVTPKTLHAGLRLLLEQDADETLGVAEFPSPILRAFKLDERGGVTYAFPQYKMARSQDLPVYYHDAAQFYWHARRRRPEDHVPLPMPMVLPRHMVVDIDTEEDWRIAERIYAAFCLGSTK